MRPRRAYSGRAVLLAAFLVGAVGGSRSPAAQEAPPPAAPMPAAGPSAPAACGAQAARYEATGFGLLVTRAGQVRVENPLRPLTPEITQVLQVVVSGKVATAYGGDFAALRRGGTAGSVEALLGGPVRWETALPVLPDPIGIVAEDGAPLAQLAFRGCEAPPAIAAAPEKPQARKRSPAPREGGARAGQGGAKTPPGFSMPQGAIGE